MKFLILNGPNVNLQRYSEPGMPGELDYNGMMDYVQSGCDQMGIETDVCQTNHEGDLIDEIQAAAGRVDGIVLNPGGYAHTSVAILDALRLCGVPAVEVLLTAPDEREALTLLMATLVTPKLLLLDEHTAALDPATAEKVLELTRNIVAEKKITCLMVTHNMHQALELGNRTLMMDAGRIVFDVQGEERSRMTVDDLLEKFRENAGKTLDNDRILLSKVEADN